MRWLLSYKAPTQEVERTTLRIKANSNGDVYIPICWYSIDWTQNCPYKWKISIDGWTETNYSWTWSSSWGIRVGYWLKPWTIHTVTIKPQVEEYWWCRALGYKGSAYASTLINIISDKSYMWYAQTSKYTWHYYKAYQYYGCTNLLDTDSEVLPDSLEIIGDNYRAYEYYGCTNLKNNAEEKIYKNVRVIWDNYRAYQYTNCTSLTKIAIRAINWAAVGNNYRYNIFSWIASTTNQATITIEWGIVDWGNWWLADNRVKNILVYNWLVTDYQSKLSWITSTKIIKNPDWDAHNYEYLEFIALADSSGKIRIPTWWYGSDWDISTTSYDWMISIDGGVATEYTWTWTLGYFSIGSWLTEGSEHKIVIYPKTVAYWWGRSFWYFGTWAEAYIKEIIHDSYKCFAVSYNNTWNFYKYCLFRWCTNLINTYEKLPTSVNTIWNSYMLETYQWCTSLTSATWEVMHKWTNIWTGYRYRCYYGCSSLVLYKWMAGYSWESYPISYKEDMLSWTWNWISVYVTREEKMEAQNVSSISQYASSETITLTTAAKSWYYIFSWNLIGTNHYYTSFGIRILRWSTQVYQYAISEYWTFPVSTIIQCNAWDVISIAQVSWNPQYWYCDNIKLEYSTNVLWLVNNKLNWIYVLEDQLNDYISNNAYYDLLDSKFKIYYYDYVPFPTQDITKYTTLIWEFSVPNRWWYNNRNYQTWVWNTYNRWVGIFNNSNPNLVYVSWSASTDRWVVWAALTVIRWTVWQTIAEDIKWNEIINWGSYWNYDGKTNAAFVWYNWWYIYSYQYERSVGWWWYQDMRACAWRCWDEKYWEYSWWLTAVSASRDGRYAWWDGNKYYAPTKWWTTSSKVWTYTWTYTNIEFSDNGMTAYLSSNYWDITQYNLWTAWDLDSKVSTWKTFNVGRSCNRCFSADKKYLYLWDGKLRVYQYTE